MAAKKKKNDIDWKSLPNLKRYRQDRSRPFWWITLVTLLVAAAMNGVLMIPLEAIKEYNLLSEGPRKPMFITYVSLYVGMWIVYYFSAIPADKPLFKVQSLRSILRASSYQWTDVVSEIVGGGQKKKVAEGDSRPPDTHEEFNKNFEKKSESVITTVAILMAAAILELDQINDIYLDLGENSPCDPAWTFLCLGLAAVLAMASFLCFVLSVDDLDTIFNNFRNKDENCVLVHFFYRRATNPKYFGMTFLILSLIFIVSIHSLTLASVLAGLAFFYLYLHIFPKIKDNADPGRGYTIPRIVIVVFPVFLHLVG